MSTKRLLLVETGMEQVNLKNTRKETRLVHTFSQLFSSNWMVPAFFSRVWAPVQKGGERKWGNNHHPRTGLSVPSWICPLKEGDDWHASLGLTGNNQFVLCPTSQLACLTWWTRHRKAPAIGLKNYKSEAAQINPANGESNLVESADSGDKEEAGRVAGCEQACSCGECTAKISFKSF